ncbi:MAG: hypothetical protein JWQ38_1750 [Flavipsychrobacter sp.]|nr:hypothetical protein [Flavipsychrobacter sp.]
MLFVKKLSACTLILIALLFLTTSASAQGWKWGRFGSGDNIEAWAVAADMAGNSFGAGIKINPVGTVKFGTISIPTVGFQTVWVKYDRNGNVLWADGTKGGNTSLINITTDPSGNLIIFGTFGSTTMQIGSITLTNTSTTGFGQYFLAKISPTGTVLWAVNDGNVFPPTVKVLVFGVMDSPGGVTTDAAGNIYISSHFVDPTTNIGSYTLTNADPSGTTTDIFAAKYTPSGAVTWATSFGGDTSDYSLGITTTSTGSVYIAGAYFSKSFMIGSSPMTNSYSFPKTNALIAEVSPAGVPLWGMGAGGVKGAYAVGITHDNADNIYLAGSFGDASISFGSTTITRPYPASVPSPALYLAQFAPSSHIINWTRTINSPSSSIMCESMSHALCDEVWLCASYGSKALIGPTPADTVAPPVQGVDPLLIAGYNSSGISVGYSSLGFGSDDQAGIACDPSGNVFICGDFFGGLPSAIAGPDTMSDLSGAEYMFVSKYGRSTTITPDTTVSPDSVICATAAAIAAGITLPAPAGYTSYYWDNGSTGTTRTVTSAGKYYVYGTICGAPVLKKSFVISTTSTTYSSKSDSACILVGSITLAGPSGASSYIWSNGSSSGSITVTTAGTYWVTSVKDCATANDTFKTKFIPVTVTEITKDTTACSSDGSITLTAPGGYTTYLWNNGTTATTITTTGKGKYWVQATKGCIIFADTIRVAFTDPPVVKLGNDTTLCKGKSLRLWSPQASKYICLWNTGSTADSIRVTDAGTYWLSAKNGGCEARDTVIVNPLDYPQPFSLGADTSICLEDVLLLSVPADNRYELKWSSGSHDSTISVTYPGTYWASRSNFCGIVSDTIVVDAEPCELWYPNAFTPNGDNHNDLSRVMGSLSKFKNFSLSIFNRFGQRVFFTQDIYAGWDGTFNGTPQDAGVYYYMIKYSLSGKHKMLKGDVTLIR